MTAISTSRHHLSVKDITLTAVFMAMNIALSSFGLPVPGGHLYLNDIVIVTASLLLNPFEAFLVGGIGAFLGDFLFYPTPMFVSLVVHGLQAFVISWIAHSHDETSLKKDIPAVLIGAVIMVVGYSLGRAYIYATPVGAVMKLPYQILQAGVGALIGLILVHKFHFRDLLRKY